MSIELDLANEMIRELNSFMDEVLGIPNDVFIEVGISAYQAAMLEHGIARLEQGTDPAEIEKLENHRKKAELDFQMLCDAAPDMPEDVIRSISLAYGFMTIYLANDKEHSSESLLRTVVQTSKFLGIAIGLISGSEKSHDAKRKDMLSIAGKIGAAAKHRKPSELKKWALSQAERLRGADAVVARRLAAMLPNELADVSKNPERLIYDALREARKPPDRLPPVTGD
ncbi:hypothetical protein [Hydrogenophaga sp. OTU3427]|uniref:hypothetical protein n=1 Tax=Hydrogenophaga sp. OTU3427 TaxID=3043856 RepID=UPI00313CC47B